MSDKVTNGLGYKAGMKVCKIVLHDEDGSIHEFTDVKEYSMGFKMPVRELEPTTDEKGQKWRSYAADKLAHGAIKFSIDNPQFNEANFPKGIENYPLASTENYQEGGQSGQA